jgi:hypothetical protein
MARQQLTIKTMNPSSCVAQGGPNYDVTYPLGWVQKGAEMLVRLGFMNGMEPLGRKRVAI